MRRVGPGRQDQEAAARGGRRIQCEHYSECSAGLYLFEYFVGDLLQSGFFFDKFMLEIQDEGGAQDAGDRL